MHVTITKLVPEGKGLGVLPDGKKVFVEKAYPGDVVVPRVYEHKKRHAFAVIDELIAPSPVRIDPFCPYTAKCGGCPWQGMRYSEQLVWKEKVVADALASIGKLTVTPLPIIGADELQHYRNKTEFSFDKNPLTGEINVGFHETGRRYDLVAVDGCPVQSETANTVLKWVQDFFRQHPVTVYHFKTGQGILKTISFRYSYAEQKVLCVLQTSAEPFPEWQEFSQGLRTAFPDTVCGVVWIVEKQVKGRQTTKEVFAVSGESFLTEVVHGIKYVIRASSFFQVNTKQATKLAELVMDRVGTGSGIAYDVYCGNGFFGLLLAKQGFETIGIELDPQLVEDATTNAQANGITNFTVHEGNARKVLKEMVVENKRADLVIIDPPRAGMHEKVVIRLAELRPNKIIYVSCNPVTFARDCAQFAELGYELTSVQPVDLFPHTHHCEVVGTLALTSTTSTGAGAMT